MESILAVRKSIISRHTVQYIVFPCMWRNSLATLIEDSYWAFCKEASFRTSSFTFRTFIRKQNVGVPHVP
jgi:hypothetical protein